jgi:hypothetical protein
MNQINYHVQCTKDPSGSSEYSPRTLLTAEAYTVVQCQVETREATRKWGSALSSYFIRYCIQRRGEREAPSIEGMVSRDPVN